ncbi:ethanolamine ammonia-lyase subunit EutC [Pyruvatibacter sp.]|uniref:ethanolamine ammonia-lyase subunit EutC n=1 Tax=Pyruvatibacter sp. TaxID=1981328 RepID=UPI0032EF268B
MTARDPWGFLQAHTDARIALGRSGNGLPTREVLAFRMAHAQARDAVYTPLDAKLLRGQISAAGVSLPVIEVSSQAPDRTTFLQRPDLGRLLTDEAKLATREMCDVVFVLADGLSARALHENAVPTLAATLIALEGWRVGPVVLARQGRVALADPIGERVNALLSVILIGERPGLSAADSLGAYLTYAPRTGRQNADRNCISNIRAGGMSPATAGHKIAYLLSRARAISGTGVMLKDMSAQTGQIAP